ncbi:hypothetical protein DPMN_005093 [Dreissena polymorpha]|uniref:Uncharacterized protein n=1 Tax=Dreissena polymorpha TaxID=45954 RepID=A0A9D4MS15_DREPO|nr:hypothetical protein DPMN_005093 [Dreissena polymorpha]
MRLKKQGEIERLTTRIKTLEEKHRLTDTKCVKCEYVRETLTILQLMLDQLKDQMIYF